MKNPDEFKGREIVVYAAVTQFDAATGTTTFLANTGAEPQSRAFDYDQNTVVVATHPTTVQNIVEDDTVTMYVRVDGSVGYDTQIGGHTVVPKFAVNIIRVTQGGRKSLPHKGSTGAEVRSADVGSGGRCGGSGS